MESHIFDIILIILAIVILLHLFYNNSLFAQNDFINEGQSHENMDDVNSPRTVNDRQRSHDGEYRDPGTIGLDRTDESKKWYHVANKLVTENNNSESKSNSKSSESKDDLEMSNRYNKRLSNKDFRINFEDLYDGTQTSDPRSEWLNREPKTLDIDGFKDNNLNEKYEDIDGNKCNLDEQSKNMKRYIRDYVLDGQAQCGCVVDKSKSEFTRDEINEYREKQLRFEGDKINKPSDPAIDQVDKMNMITMKGGVKGTGQTIADFYDDLVGSKVSNLDGPGFIMGTSVPNNKCVNPPTVDLSSGIPQGYYTGNANAGGKYFMRDNWMYNNENPNNGGLLYDGIHGSDPFINDHRMI